MILKNSKPFLFIVLSISIGLLVILIMEIYSIKIKDQEASELINLANQDTKVEILAKSIRTIQNNATDDIATFDALTLSNEKLVPFIESLEGAGQIFGLETDVVSVEKLGGKKVVEPDIIRIVMETRGAWAPTFSFIRAVGSLPHRVMIDEINLSKDENYWRLKIVLSFYSFN